MGQCKHLPDDSYEININYDLLREENPLNSLKETIIHELIHTCDGCMNHGIGWKSYINKVNKYYGYNISVTASADEKGITVHRSNKPKYKYILTCCNCNKQFKYQRMCHTIECAKMGFCKCSCGSDKFSIGNV